MENNNIVIYKYNDQEIEFSMDKNVMVNATEMGKIFGKLPKDFLKTAETKAFIKQCLIKDNYPLLGAEKESDIFYSIKNSGTWMHRLLALKFAAWLSPAFELWVYNTIEKLVFKSEKDILEINAVKDYLQEEINKKHIKLLDENKDYKIMMALKKHLNNPEKFLKKDQLNIFNDEQTIN